MWWVPIDPALCFITPGQCLVRFRPCFEVFTYPPYPPLTPVEGGTVRTSYVAPQRFRILSRILSLSQKQRSKHNERPLVEVEKELQLVWNHRSTPEAMDQGLLSIWRADSRSALPLPWLLSPGARRPHVDLSVPEAHAQ